MCACASSAQGFPGTPRHRGRLRRLLLVFGLMSTCAANAGAVANDQAAKEAELRALRQQIGELRQRLESAHSDLSEHEQALRQVEVQIGQLDRRLRDIAGDLRQKKVRLAELRKERDALNDELASQRQALARHVRAAYTLGRQDYLRLLLNQQDPATLERVLTYYRYFTRARARQIDVVKGQLLRLGVLEADIQSEAESLAQMRARAAARKAEREGQRQVRQQVLSDLQAEVRQRGQRIERLQQSEKRLEQLLRALREMFADIPQALDRRKPFSALKGQLPWPAPGKVRHGFGTSRSLGNLTWQGVLIAANAGQTVRAVYHGRVAFADWLRGLGLLVIIDHGHGFMSLYGHNQTVLKETGDWVTAGEPIATVGDTGGRNEVGLYFEIRRRGLPVNPSEWCKRS